MKKNWRKGGGNALYRKGAARDGTSMRDIVANPDGNREERRAARRLRYRPPDRIPMPPERTGS